MYTHNHEMCSQEETTDQTRPRQALRRFVLDKLALLGTIVTATTVLGFAGSWWWVLDMCAHFRVQYAALLLLIVAASAALKGWRWALVFAVPLLLNLATIVPLYFAPPTTPAGNVALRLLHFNVYTANTERARVIDYLLAADVDAIFLQEVDARWIKDLEAQSRWRVVLGDAREDNFGLVMLVPKRSDPSVTIGQTRIVTLAADALPVPTLETTLNTPGGSLRLLYTHPLPPATPAYARRNARHMAAVADWANRQSGPVVILGDLNATPWSRAFRTLMAQTTLVNSQRGHGIGATWPTGPLTLLRIPIDHCLHSPHLATVTRRVGPVLGSDHRPLLIELAWSKAQGAPGP